MLKINKPRHRSIWNTNELTTHSHQGAPFPFASGNLPGIHKGNRIRDRAGIKDKEVLGVAWKTIEFTWAKMMMQERNNTWNLPMVFVLRCLVFVEGMSHNDVAMIVSSLFY